MCLFQLVCNNATGQKLCSILRSPETCEGLNETGIEYHAKLMAHKPTKAYTTYYCRSHPVITVNYKFNPKLAVWLSMVRIDCLLKVDNVCE